MSETHETSVAYGFSDFQVHPEQGMLIRNGYNVPLQDQPFRLLVLLVSRPGKVVTREEIQAHLWPGNTYVEFDKSLRVAVSKLREALRDSANEPIYIETIPRRGYRFMAAVRVIPQETPGVSVPEATLPIVSATGATPVSPVVRTGAWRRFLFSRGVVLAATIVAIAAVMVGPLYLARNRLRPLASPAVAAHPIARRSIAVIGLRNLSGSAQDRWLSTALAEMLSTELAGSDRLRVISGEEVARAGLTEPPANTPSRESLARYANQLGADVIVFGSYAVSRDSASASPPRMRLDLRLEDLSSDAPAVSLVETGRTTDLFSLVSASGSELRQRFGLGDVSADSITAVRRTLPMDQEASRYYAEGLDRLRNFDPPGARDLLLKAAKIEPGHAGTHLALSDAWQAMGYDMNARAEAARAVELGAGLPRQELLNMQGELALLSDDWAKATDIFRSLVTFYPDNVGFGLRLAQAQNAGSRFSDALATYAGMRRPGLPRADEARIDLAESLAHLQLGEFRETIAAADRGIKIGTELGQNQLRAQGLWLKASGLERMGKSQESLAASAESETLYRATGNKRGIGLALLMSGDVLYDQGKKAEARKNFEGSLALFRELGNIRNSGITLERIGNTYYDEGALADSRKYYQLALDNYRELHWDAGIASVVGNIANVEDAEGNIAGALRSNTEGLSLFEQSGDKRGTTSTLNNMGSLEMERGTLDRALADFNRANEISRQIGYTRGVAHSMVGQGDVLAARNDIPGAIRLYEQALQKMNGLDEPGVLVPTQTSLGVALLVSGDAKQAQIHLQQAADLASKAEDHSGLTYALAFVARSLLAQGRVADALATANHAVSESRNQFSPQPKIIAALAVARVQIAQGKIAPAREAIRASLLTAQHDGYAPLAMDARILMAQTEPSSAERRHKLEALAREASQRGWNLLAADARRTHA